MHLLRRLYACVIIGVAAAILGGVALPDAVKDRGSAHPVLLTAGGVAGALLCATPAWRVLRYVITMIHEIGHAGAACLLGGRVRRIVVNRDSSGLATYALPPGWGLLRTPIVVGAGYAAPSIAGVVATAAVIRGVAGTWLWCCVGFVVMALLLLIRNFWGAWLGVVFGSVVSLITYALDSIDAAPGIVLSVVAGILLAGSVKAASVQTQAGDVMDSDAAVIGRTLHVPGRFVAWMQLVLCVVAACYGLSLLAGVA